MKSKEVMTIMEKEKMVQQKKNSKKYFPTKKGDKFRIHINNEALVKLKDKMFEKILI